MEYLRVKEIVENGEITFYVAKKNRDNDIITNSIRIHENLADGIQYIVKNVIDKIENFEKRAYNPIGAPLSHIIETVEVSKYDKVNQFIDGLDDITIANEINPEDVKFIVFEFRYNDDKLFFLRKYTNPKILNKGILSVLRGNELVKLEQSDKFGIDDNIDLIIGEDEIWIFQHSAFERIFSLDEEFKEAAESVLNNEKINEKIIGAEKLKEDILNNGNFVKRVAKIKEKRNQLLFLDNPNNTKIAIDEFNLNIDIDDKGNYIYSDKSQLGEFVNLMQDAYYKTIIGGEKGTDERR